MKYRFIVNTEQRVLIHQITGEVNCADMINDIKDASQTPGYQPEFNIIFDFREITSVNLSGNDLEIIRDMVSLMTPVLGENYKVAFVTTNEAMYGITRMWDGLSEAVLPFKMQSFQDYDKAVKWISE